LKIVTKGEVMIMGGKEFHRVGQQLQNLGVKKIAEVDRSEIVEAFVGKQMNFERYTMLYWKPMKLFMSIL
jgi:hypothetical protein